MKYIPYNKLSKSAKKEIDRKKRNTWNGVKPVVRVHRHKNEYKRKKFEVYQEF